MRYVITTRGCRACLEFKRILPRINQRLPFYKQIQLRDKTEWESTGIKNDYVQERIDDEDFTAYPICYIDGALILGAMPAEQLKIHVEKIVSHDYII